MIRNLRWHRLALLLLSSALTGAAAASAPQPTTTRIERHDVQRQKSHAGVVAKAAARSDDAAPQGSGVGLALTVAPYAGNPNECGSGTQTEVRIGDQVNVCYTITNGGPLTLTHHSLADSLDGDLLSWEPITIAPGQSHAFVRTIIATADTTRSATLTSFSTLPHYSMDDGATPDFIDISGTGTDIGFIPVHENNNAFTSVQSEFPLRLYGTASSDLCISIDGFIGFGDAACETPSPGAKPQPGYAFYSDVPTLVGYGRINVPGYLAPYWTDLYSSPGRVFVQTLGTAPDRQFVVQWNDLQHNIGSTSTATFQVVFEESSDTIRYEYRDTAFGNIADHGRLATVGLQGDPRGLFEKYSYEQASLSPDSAIVWDYTPSVDTSAASGEASISAGDPVLAVAQLSIAGLATPEESTEATLTVRNTGNRDLAWSVTEAPGGNRAHLPRMPRHIARTANATPSLTGALHAAASGRQRSSAMPGRAGQGGDFSVPAYGVSILRPGVVNFDALDPETTYTPVNNLLDWIYAGAFLDNDFSKLWVIVLDSWDFAPGTYGTVDVATGVFTVLGQMTGAPSRNWAGLTQDPVTGMVYAVNFSNNPFSAEAALYSIDFDSGEASLIGAINGPGIHPVRFFPALAVSPDGLMYGMDLYGQSLIAIDKTSGYASVVESFGLDVRYAQDLEFDQSTGDLYWAALYNVGGDTLVSEMRVVDPLSALSQPIGTLPPARDVGFEELTALAIARPSAGCVAPGDVPWLSVKGPLSGTLAPGASQDLTVALDASGLTPGRYEARVCVFSDDPRRRSIGVPVVLAVTDAAAIFHQPAANTMFDLFNNEVVAPQGAAALAAETADDFVVTGDGWSITAFAFAAIGNNGHPVPSKINVRVLGDSGDGTPSAIATCSAEGIDAYALGGSNRMLVLLPAACELAAGTYWVAWSFADIDISRPAYGFAIAVPEQNGAAAVWRNPTGALGFGCTTWSPFASCGTLVDEGARDLAFSIFATPAAPTCEAIMQDGFEDTPEPDPCAP